MHMLWGIGQGHLWGLLFLSLVCGVSVMSNLERLCAGEFVG